MQRTGCVTSFHDEAATETGGKKYNQAKRVFNIPAVLSVEPLRPEIFMFFVSGTKLTRRSHGYVADFCPICRRMCVFELIRIGSAEHVYFVPLGKGALAGYLIRCQDCGIELATDETIYDAVSPTRQPLEALIATTHRELESVVGDRLEAERRLANNTLTAEEREAMIGEPFALVAPIVAERYSATHIDGGILATLSATFLVPVASLAAGIAISEPGVTDQSGRDVLLMFAGAWLACGVIASFYLVVTEPSRYIRRVVVPLLARALAPLEPTWSELENARRQIGEQKATRRVRKIRQRHLRALLERIDQLRRAGL